MLILGPAIFVGSWPWLWHSTLARIGGYAAFRFLEIGGVILLASALVALSALLAADSLASLELSLASAELSPPWEELELALCCVSPDCEASADSLALADCSSELEDWSSLLLCSDDELSEGWLELSWLCA